MRVVVDVSFARRGPSGTQVVIDHLLPELRALGVDVVEMDGRRGAYLNLAAEAAWQVRLARAARRADVLHHPLPATGPGRTPQVITVNDLAFERVPECFNSRFRAVASRAHRLAARRATVVVAPTEATAADARELWGVQPVLAPYGPGQAPVSDRGEPRHFLYVGDDEPRKNLARLREAHVRSGVELPLVVAGSAGTPFGDGADLHRHAAALVLPSLYEGFGLPALEAMHAGTPVLVSDIAALREVCGDAARYCDPYDVDSIASALTELATVPPLREELRRRGLARASQFSWRKCAEAYARAYERAASPRSLSGA
jgi:glycosyltransferase involved in cell wall biosynthesis